MQRTIFKTLLACFLAQSSQAVNVTKNSYELVKNYSGLNFFDSFNFFSGADPTQSFVKYVDLNTANNTGLAGFASSEDFQNVIYLGVDWWNITPAGRPSTRIESKDTFSQAMWIADIKHMPGGICGSWPAYWLLGTGQDWPKAGEIDIMEGINKQTANKMVLHADSGVTVSNVTATSYSQSNITQMRGTLSSLDCSLDSAGTTGCVAEGSPGSFGSGFNENGGGIVVTEFTGTSISIWNFARDEVPADISAGMPCRDDWRAPDAYFTTPKDNFAQHFVNMKIIFNTALCGNWINPLWSSSECASLAPTCNEYVANNPQAFQDAYWLIGGIQVYQTSSSDPVPTAGPARQHSYYRRARGRYHRHGQYGRLS